MDARQQNKFVLIAMVGGKQGANMASWTGEKWCPRIQPRHYEEPSDNEGAVACPAEGCMLSWRLHRKRTGQDNFQTLLNKNAIKNTMQRRISKNCGCLRYVTINNVMGMVRFTTQYWKNFLFSWFVTVETEPCSSLTILVLFNSLELCYQGEELALLPSLKSSEQK